MTEQFRVEVEAVRLVEAGIDVAIHHVVEALKPDKAREFVALRGLLFAAEAWPQRSVVMPMSVQIDFMP
jgi:hypothetical protein